MTARLAKTARHRPSRVFCFVCYGPSRAGKSTETEGRFAVAKSWERRPGICFGEDENVLELDSADGRNSSVLACCFAAKSRRTLCDLHQAPLSTGFSREEPWSGLPFPSERDLPDPGIKPMSPAQAGGFFTTEPPGKPMTTLRMYQTPLNCTLSNS